MGAEEGGERKGERAKEGDKKKGKEETQISNLMMYLKAMENKSKQHRKQ